ncbi:MAG TPA: hypothetical protein VFG69_02220 [Nannocystaceae bacterium]|nr:hypothetical protein [Nannocystaceae bacterium]
MRRILALVLVLPLACEDEPASTTDVGTDDTTGGGGETSEGSSEGSSEGESESTDEGSGMPELESSSDDDSGGGGLACGLPEGSPPTAIVEGYTLVPVDMLELAATLRFDAATQAATGAAELTFAVGPEGGFPIFDLRQEITAIELDGVEMSPDLAPHFVGGEDFDDRMRALGKELAPCTEHVLVLEYDIALPDVFSASAPVYDAAGVLWTSDHSDLIAGHYAEQWLPMNLPHDELAMRIEIEVLGTDAPHVLGANAPVEALGPAHWRVDFPPQFSAMSPLFVLMPEALVERGSAPVRLPDGHVVTIDVIRWADYPIAMADILAATGEALISANLELGEYIHGDRYFAFVSDSAGGMEYEGATSAVYWALEHEVFHSWIARGIRPLRHRDGWLDEAWTTYSVDDEFAAELLGPDDPLEVLASDDPWTRITPVAAYSTGARVFATLAAEIGGPELRGLLREFYMAHAGELVTTEQLEAFLVAAIPSKTPAWLFERFVFGHSAPPD